MYERTDAVNDWRESGGRAMTTGRFSCQYSDYEMPCVGVGFCRALPPLAGGTEPRRFNVPLFLFS